MRNPSSKSSLSSSSPSSKLQAAAVGSSDTSNKTTPCCTKVGLKRGPWTTEEDELLATYIRREGEGRWRTLPKKAGLLRCGKSCRLRWMNYLRPSVKRGRIAPDEEDLILRLHRLLGNRWSLIAGRIPGRTDNEIKNYWNTHLSKKLISQGIDPRTHKPLETNFKSSINDNKANHILADPSSSTHFEPSRPIPIKDAENGRTSTPMGGNTSKPDDQYYQNAETTVGKDVVNMQNADHGDICTHGMNLRSSHEGLSKEDINEDINYCTDDIFSSFLNSLINEDSFNCQNQMAANCDAFVDSTLAFTFGPGWDTSAVAGTSFFDQHDSKRLKEQDEKQF